MKKTLLILILFLNFCFAENIDKLKIFAAVEGYAQKPFYEWKSGAIEPEGFDIEVIKAVSKKLNKKITFYKIDLDRSWKDLRKELLDEKLVDIVIYAYSITDERKKTVLFSRPYFTTTMGALVLKNSHINSIEKLKKSSVLALEHTTGFQWAKKNVTGGINQYLKFTTIEDLLLTGKVDAFLGDMVHLKSIANGDQRFKVLKQPLQKESLGIAVNKENSGLMEKINDALKELQKSGELDRIKKKFFSK